MNGNWDRFTDALSPLTPGLWELLAIGIGVVVLVWVTLWIRAWFRDDAADADPAGHLLTDLRELHRQGGLSDEEFRLIKTQLVGASARGKSLGSPAAESADGDKTSSRSAPTAAPANRDPSLHGRSEPPGQEVTGPSDGM